MAPRRQRLSQRRKAVGLTQESLAHRLGVERSTVARWEAGYTEPLPSIRPNVARALQVSVDELAELLTEASNAATTPVSADAEVTTPGPQPAFQSEVWLDRTEFEDLIRPRLAETVEPETVETSPPIAPPVSAELDHPMPVDVVPPADINIATTGMGISKSGVPDLSSVTTIPLNIPLADIQRRQARSRPFKRFAAAGVLILAAVAASVSFITSNNGPITPATARNPAPVAPVAPIPDSMNESTAAPAAPTPPVSDPPQPAQATVPTQNTTRSTPPAARKTPPAARKPANSAAEDYVWSQVAERLQERDQRARLRPDPSRP
ncbi:MAG: helix-turn-helix domain-containing protein [Pseudonocardiaceae bacterium]